MNPISHSCEVDEIFDQNPISHICRFDEIFYQNLIFSSCRFCEIFEQKFISHSCRLNEIFDQNIISHSCKIMRYMILHIQIKIHCDFSQIFIPIEVTRQHKIGLCQSQENQTTIKLFLVVSKYEMI